MAKQPLYYIKQFPCCNEIGVMNRKNHEIVSKNCTVKKELIEFKDYLSHDTKLIYKDLDYMQIMEIKKILDKFFYVEKD